MLIFILIITMVLVSAVEQTNSTEAKGKPTDLEDHYKIDFEQDPNHIQNKPQNSDVTNGYSEIGPNGFLNMLKDVNSCGVQIVNKHNLTAEVDHIYDHVVHPEILAELEHNQREELRNTIHQIVGPVFNKLMGSDQAGEMIVDNMSLETINWIKDTIIMLVKHHGNVEGYKFKEIGVEESMMTQEECDAVFDPKFALFEQSNVNLTLKLAKLEDDYENCQGGEEVHKTEIEDISKEKSELEKISQTKILRLKEDLKMAKEDLDQITDMYVALNKTKTEFLKEDATFLLKQCRDNFKKNHKICYDKLYKCQNDLDMELDETKKMITQLRRTHKAKLDDQSRTHRKRVGELNRELKAQNSDFKKKMDSQKQSVKKNNEKIVTLVEKFMALNTTLVEKKNSHYKKVSSQNATINELEYKLRIVNNNIEKLKNRQNKKGSTVRYSISYSKSSRSYVVQSKPSTYYKSRQKFNNYRTSPKKYFYSTFTGKKYKYYYNPVFD